MAYLSFLANKLTNPNCHPERSVLSTRFLQRATGAPKKPCVGFLGWEEDPRDLLLLLLGGADPSIATRGLMKAPARNATVGMTPL